MTEQNKTQIENKKSVSINWKKILWRTAAAIFIAYAILVVARMPYVYKKQKTDEQVAKIHATKLTMDDVMGVNLPPDPGEAADDTVEGIDANKNGIRDDVEIAIFKEYPDSAKTRAVLLQYALALQMEITQPIVNMETATETITELSRADSCVADALVPRKSPESSRSDDDMEKIDAFIKFVENKQLNTDARKKADQNFYKYLQSYSESENEICDIDILSLSD